MEIEDKRNNHVRQDITIGDAHVDRRVDRICRNLFQDVPLGQIMKAIRKGAVRLDGKKVKPQDRPALGQILSVPWCKESLDLPKMSLKRQGETSKGKSSLRDFPFSIIFHNSFLLVVDKPWGILSQPNKKNGTSLISEIWKFFPPNEDRYPALVHRLDRNTSGVVVIALSSPFLRELHSLWKSRYIVKEYMAVVRGNPGRSGVITAPLLKNSQTNMVQIHPQGLEARTEYRVVGEEGAFSLLEIKLHTGRSHQIRAHLAHMGFPIVGDYKYGDETTNQQARQKGITRPLLHASQVTFPEMGSPWENVSRKTFSCLPPKDFSVFSF